MIKSKSIESIATLVAHNIKYAPWYPVDTGHLREDATILEMTPKGFDIVFHEEIATVKGQSDISYIPFLEYGTMHSQKHVGFISVKSFQTASDTLCRMLDGKMKYSVTVKL